MDEAICKSCGARIRWAVSVNGRNIPFDVRPVRVFRIVTAIDGRDVAEHAGDLFRSHFATCPNSAYARRYDDPKGER